MPDEKTVEQPDEAQQPASLSDVIYRAMDEVANKAEHEEPGEKTPAVEEPKEETPAPEAPEGGEPPEPEPAQPTEAPTNWSAADRETFAKLEKGAQEFLLRRHREMEADYTRKTTELSGQRQAYSEMERALAPVRQDLDGAKVAPSAYVADLVSLDRAVRADPLKGIITICQRFGVDPAKLDEAWGPATDPRQLELDRARAEAASLRQQAESTGRTEAEQRITAFREAKDASGAPLHPHFDRLRETMGRLMTGGMVGDVADVSGAMAKAYELAILHDPELRGAAAAAEAKKAEDQRLAEARAKTSRAKIAAGVGRPSGAPRAPGQRGGNLSDIISAAMAQHGMN